MKPSCICTFATNQCIDDMKLFILSLSESNPGSNIVIFVDSDTNNMVTNLKHTLDLEICNNLDRYSNKNRSQMEYEGIWADFQMVKSLLIDYCLLKHPDVLFLDSDIFVINEIQFPSGYELGLSPHYIKKSDTDIYGYYNGGVVWTNQKTLGDKWREYTKTSRYFDQSSLEDCAKDFKMFEFPENWNISWWRINQNEESPSTVTSYFTADNLNIYYKGLPIVFVHTHFNNNSSLYSGFNNIVRALLLRCETKHQFRSLLTM